MLWIDLVFANDRSHLWDKLAGQLTFYLSANDNPVLVEKAAVLNNNKLNLNQQLLEFDLLY